jgi:hypothetical protein
MLSLHMNHRISKHKFENVFTVYQISGVYTFDEKTFDDVFYIISISDMRYDFLLKIKMTSKI